jgi:putative PIN family toxin of toxin-antitoxin system
MKIVFDTNVYLHAVKPGGYGDRVLRTIAQRQDIELFISLDILLEIRSKLETKFDYNREQSAGFLKHIRSIATEVEPTRRVDGVLKDADDHKILECALEADADCIVTADREMLKLKTFESISIVHPSLMKFMRP